MTPANQPHPTFHALRVAVATTISLVVITWLGLDFASLGVYSTYMTMVQFPFTIFQRGLERLLGRAVGILVGLGIASLFPDRPGMVLLLESVAGLAFFYVFLSGHLAYTFLNAGLYLAAIIEVAHANPPSATHAGAQLFLAVLVGVLIADLVTWLTGAERDLRLHPEGQPLWPIRADWINRGLMLVVSMVLTQLATRWLALPTEKAVISVFVLQSAPDLHALVTKGELRVLGAVLGGVWCLAAFALLGRMPYFALLAVLLLLGEFLAAYLARTQPQYAYAGVQMGLVIPLVLVVSPDEFGSLASVLQRLEGIAAALAVSLVVGGLWPWYPTYPAAQKT